MRHGMCHSIDLHHGRIVQRMGLSIMHHGVQKSKNATDCARTSTRGRHWHILGHNHTVLPVGGIKLGDLRGNTPVQPTSSSTARE